MIRAWKDLLDMPIDVVADYIQIATGSMLIGAASNWEIGMGVCVIAFAFFRGRRP